MQYKAEVLSLKTGDFAKEDKVAEAIQPILDRYVSDGWELHTCSIGGSNHGSMVLIIFKRAD